MIRKSRGTNAVLTIKRPPALVPGVALVCAVLLLLAGCGGGGGTGSGDTGGVVSALSLPDRIELTRVEDQNAVAAARSIRAAFSDSASDYSNAVKHSWVDDTDALDMVNEILGVVKDTAYGSFINAGPYKALVRQVGDSEQSQSGGSATTTTTEQLMEIVVDVTRASNDSPMIMKVWVFEDDGPGGTAMLIRGYFTVTEGVSAEYPYGAMTAHFKGNMLDENGMEGIELFNMAMSVSALNGNVVIENVEDSDEGDYEFHRRVRVVANADVTHGNAYVSDQETDWDTMTLPAPTVVQVAFDNDYFKVTEGAGEPMVFAKDLLTHRVFRYQLFDAVTGAAVTRNSGFPIKTADNKHGYVGYYGLWAPYGSSINNGDIVTDMAGDAYTVFRAPGKLTRHTRASMPLSELDGVELSKWSNGQDAIVAWDSDSDTFITLGYRDNNSNGQVVYYQDGVDAEYHQAVIFQQWEGAWCEAMKAHLRLGALYFNPADNSAVTPTDASTVYYHAEVIVNPGQAVDLTLYTWSFTLDTPITQTVIDGAQAAEADYWQNQAEKAFYFDAETMMLYADAGHTIPITMTDAGLDLQGTNYQWGYHIGPLNMTQYSQEQSWKAHEAETYYTWNTGADEWNQYVTVKDGNGAYAEFEAPLSFTYMHATANDVNADATHNGKTFRIEYDGFSVNIPWAYDPEFNEWTPLININDGTLMGPGDAYVIKGIEEALIMTEITDTTGIVIDDYVTGGVDEPTLIYDDTRTDLVGAVPEDAELEVIKGELIE
jgi:hypothetical protein